MGDIEVREATFELEVSDVQAQVNKIQMLMKSIMQKGQHYGVIPGTGSKVTLLKAGAEKLGFTFRLLAKFDVTIRNMDEGHREYEVLCTLIREGSEAFAGQGVGCCSTMEKKYRYRYGKENKDIADVYNTVLKMAKKRAHVDAMITTCAASDIFTQDMEDVSPEMPSEPADGLSRRSEPASGKILISDAEKAVMAGMATVLEMPDFTEIEKKAWHERVVEIVRNSTDRGSELRAARRELDEALLSKRAKVVEHPEDEVEERPAEDGELEIF